MTLYRTAINFIEHYRSLFLNPAENAAEIIITTALIIIGAVIIWIFTGMIISQARSSRRRLRTDKKLRLVLLLYFGALVIFGVSIFSVASQVTSNSSFCGRVCHSMNPAFQSWRRSAHATVPCSSCHMGDSLRRRLFGEWTAGTHNVAREVSGNYLKPINARSRYSEKKVPAKRCMRCHFPEKKLSSEGMSFNVNHPKHRRAGLRCTNCHNRVAHPQAENYSPLREKNRKFAYKDYMTTRQGCWRCHRKKGWFYDATGLAHKGPFLPKVRNIALADCRICHIKPGKNLPKFHEPARGVKWARGLAHGEVARQNFRACRVCHVPTGWCGTRCHFGITIPHPKNWPQTHPEFARRDIKPCRGCHKLTPALDFCAKRCHHDKFQKQFNLDKQFAWRDGKEQHGVVVRAAGAGQCLKCHDQSTWCSTQCHQGVTMPHAPGWRGVHFKYVNYVPDSGWDKAGATCAMCHDDSGKGFDYCGACHHARFGGLGPIGLMKWVRRNYQITLRLEETNKRLPCEDCHIHQGLKFCRDCHEGRMKRSL